MIFDLQLCDCNVFYNLNDGFVVFVQIFNDWGENICSFAFDACGPMLDDL